MNPRRLSVAVLCDRFDWVLGEMAALLRDRVNAASSWLQVEPYEFRGGSRFLADVQHRHDVVHFLSPWHYFRHHGAVWRPCIHSIHHVALWGPIRRTRARADAVTFMAREWMDAVGATGWFPPERLWYLPYGLDCREFRPRDEARALLRDRVGCGRGTILLGLAAKRTPLDRLKGIDRYWKLLEVLRRGRRDVLLLIFGPTGPGDDEWSTDDIPSDLRSSVRLMGFVKGTERTLSFGGLDFYVCLSRREGGPYPVLQSMACGVKTISTPVGTAREVVEDGRNGFLVEATDYLERVPRILDAWSNPDGRDRDLVRRAREAVLTWDRQACAARYERICAAAVRTRRARGWSPELTGRIGLTGRLWTDVRRRTRRALRGARRLRSGGGLSA